jgi:lysophospholipase L1-like esterase
MHPDTMTGNFLFIGDSLIEFFNWQERFPASRIANFGSAGETAEGLLARLPGITARIPAPDLVMVMTGINNIAMEDYTFLATYEKIISQLQKNYQKSLIVMTSLLPIDFSFLGEAVPRVNRRLVRIAVERRVHFLDLYPLFIDENSQAIGAYYDTDGVHLSEAGYEVWARALEENVFPLLAG